jgi:tetraacyldisaccharide 4'-kinase
VRLEPPAFWYRQGSSPWASVLAPLGAVYGGIASARLSLTAAYRAQVPVICIGNFTGGGTGKTPLALAVAGLIRRQGAEPAFLTRGFGGSEAGPHQVDPAKDDAARVGDEPLLLARTATTIVARDRAAGARLIEGLGQRAIVMDDGLQNPQLRKDFTIAAIDRSRGLGNGRVMPAGPLRMGLDAQLRLTDAILILGGGDGEPPAEPGIARRFDGPVLQAETLPDAGAVRRLSGARVVAFAGIARPEKLFRTLERLGAVLAEAIAFPDHHALDERDARRVLARAEALRARIVTTEKDLVRLGGLGAVGRLREAAEALPVEVRFCGRDEERLSALLAAVLAGRFARRR